MMQLGTKFSSGPGAAHPLEPKCMKAGVILGDQMLERSFEGTIDAQITRSDDRR